MWLSCLFALIYSRICSFASRYLCNPSRSISPSVPTEVSPSIGNVHTTATTLFTHIIKSHSERITPTTRPERCPGLNWSGKSIVSLVGNFSNKTRFNRFKVWIRLLTLQIKQVTKFGILWKPMFIQYVWCDFFFFFTQWDNKTKIFRARLLVSNILK